ncbi:MAG: hypothetical protein U5L45_15940 [Saprospiraceae bacterium]|nr:hypothetical protein [Saprospiraceae bacterium]
MKNLALIAAFSLLFYISWSQQIGSPIFFDSKVKISQIAPQ